MCHVRHMPKNDNHSIEGIELAKEFIACLEDIPGGCAEFFPLNPDFQTVGDC